MLSFVPQSQAICSVKAPAQLNCAGVLFFCGLFLMRIPSVVFGMGEVTGAVDYGDNNVLVLFIRAVTWNACAAR